MTAVVIPSATSAAAPPKVKKRLRAAKVGVQAAQYSIPEATLPDPPLPPTTAPAAAATSTRDAALEASKRADDLIRSKWDQEPVAATSSSSLQEVPLQLSHRTTTDTPDDAVVAAAKAAAEEAQQLQQQQQPRTLSGRLGGLFRRQASPPPMARGSSHGNVAASNRPPGPQAILEPLEAAANSTYLSPPDAPVLAVPDYQPTAIDPMLEIPKPSATKWGLAAEKPRSSSATTLDIPIQQIVVPVRPASPQQHSWMHDLLRDFRAQVHDAMDQLSHNRATRRQVWEEQRQTTVQLHWLNQQIQSVTAAQTAAAEEEDFELADRLGSTLDAHEQEHASATARRAAARDSLRQLQQSQQESVALLVQRFDTLQSALREFQGQQVSQDRSQAAQALERFTTVSKQLSIESERLNQDLKHLERDEALVADERQELENTISEQSGQYELLREQARERLTATEAEIEDLRQQLAAKQASAAQLRTEMAGHDEAVLRVRVKFSRQLNRVQQKETSLRGNRQDWELEKVSFDSQKQAHERDMAAHADAMVAHDDLLARLAQEIGLAETFGALVAQEISEQDEKVEEPDNVSPLQDQVLQSEAALGQAKEALDTVTARLAQLEHEKKDIEFRVPQLEELKTAAAARRDFKTAGSASKEIKDSGIRLREICESEAEARGKLAVAEETVRQCEAELQAKQDESLETERVSARAEMERLAERILRLVERKKNACQEIAHDDSIQAVGSYVLDSQIRFLKFEGQLLGEKFGGWEDLIADLDEDNSPVVVIEEANPVQESGDQETSNAPLAESMEPEAPAPDTVAEEHVATEDKTLLFAEFRELTQRLSEVEASIESAVAEEDYEKADELQEVVNELVTGLAALGLTEEEMSKAMSEIGVDGSTSAAVVSEASEEQIESTAMPAAQDDKLEPPAAEQVSPVVEQQLDGEDESAHIEKESSPNDDSVPNGGDDACIVADESDLSNGVLAEPPEAEDAVGAVAEDKETHQSAIDQGEVVEPTPNGDHSSQ
jgi:hypothetical protein